MRISNGEHKYITIKPGDTVIFSSSVIPGNERSVQILKDNLARQGAIVYHSEIVDIHSSGHASQDELRDIIKIMNPKFFVPIHGYFFMRSQNALNGVESGVPKENILLPDNGQVVEITKTSAKITDKTIPASYVLVDGLGVGDVGEVVLRDRRLLAQEGMIVIIATVSRRDGRLVKNPDIISRGFIYLKENQKLLEDIRTKTRGIVSRIPRHQPMDGDYLKSLFRDQIGQFVYNKTNRRPMILPVIIEV
jgi:ribonuclease J